MKGGLSIILNLERCAYVPGESILISADINNNSSNRVKSVEAYLQQNIMFEAKGVQRFCRGQSKLGLVSQGSVKPGQAQYWRQEALKIPALPPTKLAGCKIIIVDYLFNFILYIENASNIVINIPIVIGTIPLTNQQHMPPPRPPPPITTATPSAPIYEPSPRPVVFPSAPVLPDLSLLRKFDESLPLKPFNLKISNYGWNV
uniref:Arrestin C-terminal-like domain-containing protein n=1 Tax=Romanomermis culicivorax TaxID=13658 RepID=A0A915I144_ROMCU